MPRLSLSYGCEVFAGELSVTFADRTVLATDNSIYQLTPEVMAFPRCVEDLVRIAHTAQDLRFAERVALYGDGCGGAYASRAASRDHQFVAAVCNGGLWATAPTLGWSLQARRIREVRCQTHLTTVVAYVCPDSTADAED